LVPGRVHVLVFVDDRDLAAVQLSFKETEELAGDRQRAMEEYLCLHFTGHSLSLQVKSDLSTATTS